MFRRSSLRSHPSAIQILTSIILLVSHCSPSQSLPFRVLAILPDSSGNLTRDWRLVAPSSSSSMAIHSLVMSKEESEVLGTLCEAVQRHQPHLLLSFLKQADSLFPRIVSASVSTPLLTVSSDYGAAVFTVHPQVSDSSDSQRRIGAHLEAWTRVSLESGLPQQPDPLYYDLTHFCSCHKRLASKSDP